MMKKYTTLGELLVDYRHKYELSQMDFAGIINVDVRTVQRWEKNMTLINPDKEEDIVLATLLPYQLIRNLNAVVPIPTYYDFNIHKYSLTNLTNELPNFNWFEEHSDERGIGLRTIGMQQDIKHISHFMQASIVEKIEVDEEMLKKATEMLPELNMVVVSDSGYYAGHVLIVPLKEEAYLKLRNREMNKSEINASHIADYTQKERPIFFNYDTTADCNDNILYIVAAMIRFFKKLGDKDYIFASYTERYDTLKLSGDMGIEVVWENKERMEELGLSIPPRFMEGKIIFHSQKEA